jgi:hypothetical protein
MIPRILVFLIGSPSKEELDKTATGVSQTVEAQEKVGYGTVFQDGRV